MQLKDHISLNKAKTYYTQIYHPSIFYTVNPSVGSRGGWSLSQRSSGERRGTPWTGRQSITGPHRDKRDKQPHTLTLTLTPKDNLESPINMTCMFLDGGRKPEYQIYQCSEFQTCRKTHQLWTFPSGIITLSKDVNDIQYIYILRFRYWSYTRPNEAHGSVHLHTMIWKNIHQQDKNQSIVMFTLPDGDFWQNADCSIQTWFTVINTEIRTEKHF